MIVRRRIRSNMFINVLSWHQNRKQSPITKPINPSIRKVSSKDWSWSQPVKFMFPNCYNSSLHPLTNNVLLKMAYNIFVQLLVCLRILIRRCVYDNVNKDEIHKLFPAEVLPELQRLLTLLLQKFQKEWREDISKDQVRDFTFILMSSTNYSNMFIYLLVC